jgi:hypothetical protein
MGCGDGYRIGYMQGSDSRKCFFAGPPENNTDNDDNNNNRLGNRRSIDIN